ncbi:MAG: hypothetical protein KIH65_002075 [Candidatus Uhrbacteria bacterium]|nr:hypothetical protein [Candidatus Uhrbacteria bacterium]
MHAHDKYRRLPMNGRASCSLTVKQKRRAIVVTKAISTLLFFPRGLPIQDVVRERIESVVTHAGIIWSRCIMPQDIHCTFRDEDMVFSRYERHFSVVCEKIRTHAPIVVFLPWLPGVDVQVGQGGQREIFDRLKRIHDRIPAISIDAESAKHVVFLTTPQDRKEFSELVGGGDDDGVVYETDVGRIFVFCFEGVDAITMGERLRAFLVTPNAKIPPDLSDGGSSDIDPHARTIMETSSRDISSRTAAAPQDLRSFRNPRLSRL